MKKAIPLVLLAILFTFCSQEKKLLRKASNAVVRSDFEGAVSYYDKVIQNNESSFFGNAGKGIVLSEFMERHEQAIPYLEKALKNSPKKSKPIINRDLGRSYHFIGNYERALYYYGKTDNDPDYSDYDEFLTKRIADCKYAIEHPKVALPENQSVKNIGNTINTEMPEYTPVYVDGKLLFSAKRQDDPKEKKNGFDGRYYENIYISTVNPDGSFSKPEIYNLPATRMEKKRGESIMSASHDGKKLFLFKGGKIYETKMNDLESKPEKLDKTINFSPLQNHAALSADGNTLYFSAVSEKEGRGGADIYMSTKKADGNWSDPMILGDGVNTFYDEDSPYFSENGTLFFSSNGHPGYGGFDVYRSRMENGSWTKAENLGQPINSAGDDIYFTLLNNTSNGYYASARPGGYGDLDIYKVHYLSTEVLPCKPEDILTINAQPDPNNPFLYTIELNIPEAYKNNVRQYAWDLNGKPLMQTSDKFQHTFTGADEYKLSARLVVYCDTCPTLIGMCTEKSLAVENKKNKDNMGEDYASTDPDNKSISKNNSGKNTKGSKTGKDKGKSSDLAKNDPSANAGSGPAGNASDKTNTAFLGENQLKELGWNTGDIYFNSNDYTIRGDAKEVLDQNISVLKNKNNLWVHINGYADSKGQAAYNKNLSAKRANSVKQYLVSNGISAKRIKATHALGESDLVNNCTDDIECDEAQHQLNRRVKFDVMEGPVKAPGSITQK